MLSPRRAIKLMKSRISQKHHFSTCHPPSQTVFGPFSIVFGSFSGRFWTVSGHETAPKMDPRSAPERAPGRARNGVRKSTPKMVPKWIPKWPPNGPRKGLQSQSKKCEKFPLFPTRSPLFHETPGPPTARRWSANGHQEGPRRPREVPRSHQKPAKTVETYKFYEVS